MKENNRDREQAAAQFESISEMLAAVKHAQECEDGDECAEGCVNVCEHLGAGNHDEAHGCEHAQKHDEDAARERIQEDPLEVAADKGERYDGTRHFMILLCTGGPAVRIVGELDEHGEPETARMQYQDWFKPWTDYKEANESVLLEYARNFYFAEA